jgi:hypothetical protein
VRVLAPLRHGWRSHFGVLSLYFLLTLAFTWPLAINLDRVPADLADPVMSIWLLWWNATVMPLTDTWWNGLSFFPATNTVALSDHRLGLGIITTPAIAAGASPVMAYNIAFAASFVLSSMAAYGLCAAVTGSRLASFVGGLIFGFNPFRAGHLEHLELLSVYWLPVMLLALHTWRTTGRHRWLIAFSAAAFLQALTSGYYYAFSMVLVGLWGLWFALRQMPLSSLAAFAAAIIAPLIAVSPILFRYRQAHAHMGLRRGIGEIETLSADVMGLLTAPERLLLWNSPPAWFRPEGAIMPGLLAVAVVAIASVTELRRRSHDQTPLIARTRAGTSILAVVTGFAALIPAVAGPVDFAAGPIRISISDSFKPLTLAIVFLTLLVATSSPARHWLRQRSSLGFYVLATLAMWILAMGPTVRLFGEPVFYKAPYSWLMLLPGFSDAFRAPARFALLAVLTLSVAAALGFAQLLKTARPRVRAIAAASLAVGVMAESWMVPMPMLEPPRPLEIPGSVPGAAVIMEWPPGVYEDAAAMYRSTLHHRRIVNGLSGYTPPHYGALTAALADGEVNALMPLAALSDIAVFFARNDPETPTDIVSFAAATGATKVAETSTHVVFLLRRHAGGTSEGTPAGARRDFTLASSVNAGALRYMIDRDYSTAWGISQRQSGGERFEVDLGTAAAVRGVVIASGDRITLFARRLAVDVSLDKNRWTEAWRGDFATPSVAAAIARPARMDVTLDFPPTEARYIRVRQLGTSQEPWAVSEFAVLTAQ